MELTKEQLLTGDEFDFENDEHQLSFWYEQISTWDDPYKVYFNGTIVGAYKTFTPAYNKVKQLVDKYGLELVWNTSPLNSQPTKQSKQLKA